MKSTSVIVVCALLAHASSIKINNDNDDVDHIGTPELRRLIEATADVGFYSRSANEFDADSEPSQVQTSKDEETEEDKQKATDIKEHKSHKAGNDMSSNCHDAEEIDRQATRIVFHPTEDIFNTLNGKCIGHGKQSNDTQPPSEPDTHLELMKLEAKKKARSDKIANISYKTGKPMNEVADDLDKKPASKASNSTKPAEEQKETKEDKTKVNPKPKEEAETLA